MEETVQEFRIVGADGNIIGAAPRPEKLARITKLLTNMRKNYQYEILADALIIPVPSIWGKANNPQQWWSIHNYEILSAAFCHKVETFLKSFSPYLPKEEKGFEPATP